jgi:type 2 lantibiotic biosynthesis protein LanM
MEFVESAACATTDELIRFYKRQGSLLAILHVLAATDFHYENVIADGEHPLLIDLEALFHPSLRTADPADAFEAALARMDNSVLAVGLLPQPMRLSAGTAGIDVSALGSTSGQLSPRGVPRWVGGATDEARVVYERVALNPGQHRSTLDGRPVDVLEYAESLLDGFRRTYQLLLERRPELLAADGPLARFADDTVRLLLRPTVVYARLLTESFHPDLLRDGLERDRFLDRLWVAVPYQPRLVGAIVAEQRDLWRGDIPKFTTRAASSDVRSAGPRRFAASSKSPGWPWRGVASSPSARPTWSSSCGSCEPHSGRWRVRRSHRRPPTDRLVERPQPTSCAQPRTTSAHASARPRCAVTTTPPGSACLRPVADCLSYRSALTCTKVCRGWLSSWPISVSAPAASV